MDKDIQEKLGRVRELAVENVKRATSGLKQGAELARTAGSGAGKRIGNARVQASKAVDHANRLVVEHPIAATAAAAAAGALAAWLFPKATRRVRDATSTLQERMKKTGDDSASGENSEEAGEETTAPAKKA